MQIKKYIRCIFSGTARMESWKSNGMSEESIENIADSIYNQKAIFLQVL